MSTAPATAEKTAPKLPVKGAVPAAKAAPKLPVKAAAPAAKPATAPKTAAPKAETKAETKGKPAGKVAAPKLPAPKREVQVGEIMTFVAYKKPEADPLFQAGDDVYVHSFHDEEIEKDGKKVPIKSIVAIKPADAEAANANPDFDTNGVSAETLAFDEVKFKKQTAAKTEVAPLQIRDVGEMGKLLKREGSITTTIRGLLDDANKNFFYAGGLLAHAKRDKIHEAEGFPETGEYTDEKGNKLDGWEAYVLTNFGFRARTARYYIDVYQAFSGIEGFDVKALPAIGWSKASIIARVITAENVAELSELARTTDHRSLRQIITTRYVTATDGRSLTSSASNPRRRYAFTVAESGAAVIDLVLAEAQKRLGLSTVDQVIEHILVDWGINGGNLAESTVKKLGAKVKQAEKPDTSKVVAPAKTAPAVVAASKPAPKLPVKVAAK